jgi:hypothetical protein
MTLLEKQERIPERSFCLCLATYQLGNYWKCLLTLPEEQRVPLKEHPLGTANTLPDISLKN